MPGTREVPGTWYEYIKMEGEKPLSKMPDIVKSLVIATIAIFGCGTSYLTGFMRKLRLAQLARM